MNFTAVRGYNAYTHLTAKTSEPVKLNEVSQDQDIKKEQIASVFDDPVDIVSISVIARNMSISMMAERETAQSMLRDWLKESGSKNDVFSQNVQGQSMEGLMSSNGIKLEADESSDVNLDVWCAVTVTGKNAAKAKAIQNLLNTTPSNINWGLMLQKLPVDEYTFIA